MVYNTSVNQSVCQALTDQVSIKAEQRAFYTIYGNCREICPNIKFPDYFQLCVYVVNDVKPTSTWYLSEEKHQLVMKTKTTIIEILKVYSVLYFTNCF